MLFRSVFVVDDTILQPNGIAFNPAGDTLYVCDTGGVSGYNGTKPHTIYKFDVTNNGTEISNRRAFYLTSSYIPDGLKVSQEGLVLTADGNGIDVLDNIGQLIMRVQMNYTAVNFAWVGNDLRELWVVGQGAISRIRWNIQGQQLA